MGADVLVPVPKGNADTWGIGLLEVFWKVVETVIETHIKLLVQLHNVLHRFWSGRGMGAAIIELILVEELASVDQDPLLLVFLDLRKSYDNLDPGRLPKYLEGNGVGLKLRG